MAPEFTDLTPRYAPDHVIVANAIGTYRTPVIGWRFYPPGQAPKDAPIKPEYGVLECQTTRGSRWYGCREAYINSELRMVVIGADRRDEVRMTWAEVPEDRRI